MLLRARRRLVEQFATRFYDALAGGADSGTVEPKVAEITRELVGRIRGDLTVDWTSRESTPAGLRRTIKRLLRKHGYTGLVTVAAGGGGPRVLHLDGLTDLILDQARVMYAAWPETSPL
jgi:hypothetical protein